MLSFRQNLYLKLGVQVIQLLFQTWLAQKVDGERAVILDNHAWLFSATLALLLLGSLANFSDISPPCPSQAY